MCGKTLVTMGDPNNVMLDTGTQGFMSRSVYVMEKLDYVEAFNILIELDRDRGCPVIKYVKKDNNNKGNELANMKCIYVDFLKNLSMPQLLGVAGDLGIDSEKS